MNLIVIAKKFIDLIELEREDDMATRRITIGRSIIYLNGFASNTHMIHTCNKSDYSTYIFSLRLP